MHCNLNTQKLMRLKEGKLEWNELPELSSFPLALAAAYECFLIQLLSDSVYHQRRELQRTRRIVELRKVVQACNELNKLGYRVKLYKHQTLIEAERRPF
jgi:hypothetical protein